MINSNLSFSQHIEDIKSRLKSPEQMLGKGLDQPFNSSNSGARKILYGVQKDHAVPLIHTEPSIVQTGYENRWGDLSSSIITFDDNMEVIATVPKFSFLPRHHYYMVLRNTVTGEYVLHERREYEHTTESHGYMYNNRYIDSLSPGDIVPAGKRLRESTSYDEYGNRCDGANLMCLYLATDKNTEDSVILSDVAANYKLATPELHYFTIVWNDNDIPLNIHGDENLYKAFPDIGEEVKNGIFCALRREEKEHAYYTQDYNRLRTILMSDEKYTVNGTIVDISIKCNNPQLLANNEYNSQLKKYNDESMRFASEIVQVADRIKANDPNARFHYKLTELVSTSRQLLSGAKFINDKKVFGNTIIDVVTLVEKPMDVGDKLSDRYGGKGVVSFIVPQELMPRNEFGEYADVIINQSTCVNRENPGQLFETSLNHINHSIINFIKMGSMDAEDSFKLILRFLDLVSPEQAAALRETVEKLDIYQLEVFLDSIIRDEYLYTSLRPITDNFTLDKLQAVYDEFPWIKQSYLMVPIADSNGNIRHIRSRRPVVMSKKYMHRMKQHSDEKFSSTSLSATNIKNLNTRNKSSKNYKALHSNTPIAMGEAI